MTKQWNTVAKEDINDFTITIEAGNLVITGKSITHEGARDVQIDASGLRGWHYV